MFLRFEKVNLKKKNLRGKIKDFDMTYFRIYIY